MNSKIDDVEDDFADTSRPIGEPIIRLSDLLFNDEVRLEGAEVSKTTYAALYEKYGDTYGTAENTNNFVLPDFRNRAIWGATSFGYIDAGLPNITGEFNPGEYNPQASGAFYSSYNGSREYSGAYAGHRLYFDASRSSAIYGNSSTVQPPAIKVRVVTRYK